MSSPKSTTMPAPTAEEEERLPAFPVTPMTPNPGSAADDDDDKGYGEFVPALLHLVTTVFNILPTSRTFQALIHGEVTNVTEFMALSQETIKLMTYPTSRGESTLTSPLCQCLMLATKWMRSGRSVLGHPLRPEEWMDFKSEHFDNFIESQVLEPSQSIPIQPMASHTRTSLADSFTKGIKRDVSQYSNFKEDRFWDTWNRDLLAKGRTHGISDVFDPDYVPQTPDKIELFKVQQAFVYSVFVTHVLTASGKNIVREYTHSGDAQAIYKRLLQRYTNSPEAKSNAQDLKNKLAVLHVDDTWKNTATAFLNHWSSLNLQLDEITKKADQATPEQRKSQLVNAVASHPELKLIIRNDRMTAMKGAAELTYDEYLTLLVSAAAEYDKEHSKPSRRAINRTNRQNTANAASQQSTQQTRSRTPNNNRNTSTSNSTSGTTATPSTPKMIKLESDIWSKLTPEVQQSIKAYNRTLRTNAPRRANKTTTTTAPVPSVVTTTPPTIPLSSISTTSTVPAANPESIDPTVNLRAIMSSHQEPSTDPISVNGRSYRACMAQTTYSVSKHATAEQGSLIDGGANGGLAGADTRLIESTDRYADITGIDSHKVKDVIIGTCAGRIMSTNGPIICLLHQYAYTGKGSTIHSVIQLESFGLDVNDRSLKLKHGKQRIMTPDGYIIPLQIREGLAYLDMRPPTDFELENLPHVVLTSDDTWDPTVFDNEVDPDSWTHEVPPPYDDLRFNEVGEYNLRIRNLDIVSHLDHTVVYKELYAYKHEVKSKEPNYEDLRPNFGWAPIDVIKRTFAATTQLARNVYRLPMRKHFRSRFPALNVLRRNEPVATDTIWSDTPAFGCGSICAQLFVGRKTLQTDVYGMKTDKEFVNTLEDNIRKRGAMDLLISDRAQAEVSKKAHDILRSYHIRDWQSEP
ncbi:MAG TPA: hypothetical protein VFK47_03615, partial [Ktedonobacteraceae bacterium]|nr:hypothetical protein [Ktedonobacteraceae bacterium]